MTKKYMMVWGGVIVFVFAAVTILCLYAKKNNINNISENMTVEKAEKYFGLFPGFLPEKGQKKVMTLTELERNGLRPEIDKSCDGYVIVTNKTGVPKYKAYLSCENHETEGFDSGYLKNDKK